MKIIKFGTNCCPACMEVSRILKKNNLSYQDVDCLDGTEETSKLMEAYNITNHVPVVICIDDSGFLKRFLNPAEVKDWIAHSFK